MKSMNKLMLVALMAVGISLNANALLITPTTQPQWSGSLPKNPDANDVEDITGTSAELTLAYKKDVGGSEEGMGGSYESSFDPANDPEDATIRYTGGSIITGTPIYLLVKDGDHDPRWYVFDISGWNGTETITLDGFWPNGGAISHVSIYNPGGTSVPDAGSSLALLGVALTSIGFLRRKLA